MRPDAIMIMAAGFGTRMGALTEERPKPLIKVGGKALIDHSLDLASQAGLRHIVVNTHYKAEMLAQHLQARPQVQISHETPNILETGGGLKKALPLLGDKPVFTLNSDMIWTGKNPLQSLLAAWDPIRMDALLMLVPRGNALGTTAAGDFFMGPDNRLVRRGEKPQAPFIYSGAQILKTDLLAGVDRESFSLNLVWDKMLAKGRVFGVAHGGSWVDVGRPEGIATAEMELSKENDV